MSDKEIAEFLVDCFGALSQATASKAIREETSDA